MSLFFSQIFTFLTSPPGNLIYHLVLVFTIAGTLQRAILLLRSNHFPQERRTVWGLVILLGLQVTLFLASSLALQGLFEPRSVLPPLDRAVSLLALVWITWLWAFPEPARRVDFATVLLSILALIAFAITVMFWSKNTAMGFSSSIFESLWQGFSLAVVLLGIFALVRRQPNGWSNGLAMLVLAFIGHMLSLAWTMDGDYPGFVRLTQMALIPILITILQRFSITTSTRATATQAEKFDEDTTQDRRINNTDPKTLRALMSLAAEVSADKIGRAMTRSISQSMLADLCYLFTLADDKSISIVCGYDLIREVNMDGTSVNKDAIPLLANAIQRGRPLRLPASSTSSDMIGLSQILQLQNPGHLLCVPIASHERGALGGILILSPHSDRLWTAEDEAYLTEISSLFIPVLERGHRAFILESELDQAHQESRAAQEQAAEAARKFEQAAQELEKANEKLSQSQFQSENMASLLTMQDESQRTIESLREEIAQIRRSGEDIPLPVVSAQSESDLRRSQEELERLKNSLAAANQRIQELEQSSSSPFSGEQTEIIASISQELRQPMSSIVGYTDLLLSESVGILGALQGKFIERIKTSTERISGLVDDLIRITNLETGRIEFKAELIDLNLIIDNAMAYTGTQIREKNITLRLDIPEISPRVQTDRDALQQVFIHLLQNATAATEAEGNITLRVLLQNESNDHFISIQVTDSGGGIPSDDIPRVFARRYRAEHSLIQGLGDTGVGLSIARTLTEAMGGRIWVETEAGSGSTFSVILPVLLETEIVK
jgi:signal transduction histidine kinase